MARLQAVTVNSTSDLSPTGTTRPRTPMSQRSANPFGDGEAISSENPFRDGEAISSSSSSVHSDAEQPRPLQPIVPHISRSRISRRNREDEIAPAPPISYPQELNEKFDYVSGNPTTFTTTVASEEKPGIWQRVLNEPKTVELPTKEKSTRVTDERNHGLWSSFTEEFRKNYCPRESPAIILPSCPTDAEKYCYVSMNRIPILLCGVLSTLALTAGAWLFIKAAWYYSWYALYALLSEFYIYTSFGITLFGKAFDLPAHKKLLVDTPLNDETAPTVDVYLPVCKEPLEILENTWKHIAQLQYPAGKMKPFVLDDGAQDEVKELCARFGFTYMRRPNRPELKKAGNMRHAFSQTSGAFFVVFDADFCPRPDFLLELLPVHMANPKIAIVQTPQFFRSTGNQTWTEQGAGSVQEYFYRLVQVCRNTWGGAICVGSNAVYRREALEAVGGTAPAECSEDVHTGFYAVTRGWTVRYLPLVLACGVCPDIPRAFFSQQMRWCTGSLSLLTHRDFWKSSLSPMQKFCYLTGMFYYSTTAIAAFLNPLPAPLLLWTRPDLFKYYNLFFAFPSIILGLITLRLWARSRYTLSVQYTQVIMAYAYLQAIWDRFFGTKMTWLPSGDGKAHKNHRYRNMRILAWGWTIAHNTFLISGAAVRICQGMEWFQVVPALFLDAFNLLCVHRFLLYNHPKD